MGRISRLFLLMCSNWCSHCGKKIQIFSLLETFRILGTGWTGCPSLQMPPTDITHVKSRAPSSHWAVSSMGVGSQELYISCFPALDYPWMYHLKLHGNTSQRSIIVSSFIMCLDSLHDTNTSILCDMVNIFITQCRLVRKICMLISISLKSHWRFSIVKWHMNIGESERDKVILDGISLTLTHVYIYSCCHVKGNA